METDGSDWSKEQLGEAKRILLATKSGTPKFLFRGFNAKSGGGHPMLNSPRGVVPHAFLGGKTPTTIFDIPDLLDNTTNHLQGKEITSRPSEFSSWTQDPETALDFALAGVKDGDSSMLAVVDTSFLGDRAYHSPDLMRAGLARLSYSCEYLIYGPISGPGYQCIPVTELWDTTKIGHLLYGRGIKFLKFLFGRERISLIERGAVESSRQLATVLLPRDAGVDKIMMLTAKFVAIRAADFQTPLEFLSDRALDGFLYYCRDDLQTMAVRGDAGYISLVDPSMNTDFSPALMYEVQMLMAAENVVHSLDSTYSAAMSTWFRIDQNKKTDSSFETAELKWTD